MNTIQITKEVSDLLQRKVTLLTQHESITQELVTLEPLITSSQKKLLQSTCTHPNYKETYANTDNKYCGWGEYECTNCGHTKTQSW